MLNLELAEPPNDEGTDIVSVAEMKRYMKLSSAKADALVKDNINEAAAGLHGRYGSLNRSVFPCTWVRYMRAWPRSGEIQLPLPPLIEVESISYGELGSPGGQLDVGDYVVNKHQLIGTVTLRGRNPRWPTIKEPHDQAIAIRYRAGFEEYPLPLKRLVKLFAKHFFDFPEAAINDTRVTNNRQVEFGIEHLNNSGLRVPVAYDDWD